MPDPKVINKISSTLEEIRDILSGSKPSKIYNSVQAIASSSTSIALLMTELVDVVKETQKISLKETFIKSSQKNDLIKDTNKSLEGIKNILSTISDNTKSISKKTNLKLSNTSDKKILDKIFKDNIKDTKDNKILGIIDVVSKLRDVKLKDLFTAKFKINKITEIYDKLVNSFKKFKSDKEVKKVNAFALSSIEIIRKLSTIAFITKFATLGAKAIDAVFFGKGGLVQTMIKMKEHEKEIKKAKKISNDLFVISGKLFLVALMMTGIALLGLPAMVGTLMAAGMVVVFGLSFSVIGLMEKQIKKGITLMVPMMTSLILAGVGLWLLNKGTKDMKWKQLALAGTAIVGFGMIAALLGIPYVAGLVSLGCVSLSLMGVALIAIGGGIALFGLMVTDKSIKKVSEGIPKIFKAITSIFTNGDDEKPSFGNTLLGFITGCLRLRGAVFASGALMIIGISLGFLGLTLRSWENFNIKAIDNIGYALGKLDNIFGLNIKNKSEGFMGFVGDIGNILTSPLQMTSLLLKAGKTFVRMSTLLISGIVLGLIKNSIDKWKNFDINSLDNVDKAITKLDDIFGLGIKGNNVISDVINGGIGYVTGTFQMAGVLLKAGKTFVRMGTLLMAVSVTDKIVKKINSWKGSDLSAIDKVLEALTKFSDYFGIDFGGNRKGFLSKVFGGIGDAIGGIFGTIVGPFELGATLMKSGSQFMKLGVLSTAVGVVDKLVNTMIKAGENSSKMSGALDNVFDAFDKMIDYFFNDDRLDKSMWDCIKEGGLMVAGGILAGPIGVLGGALLASDSRKTKLSILATSVGIVDKMVDAIIKMGKYSGDVNAGISSTFDALNKIVDYLFGTPDGKGADALNKISDAMNKNSTKGLFTVIGGVAGGILGGPAGALIGGGIGYLLGGDGSSQIKTQLEVLTSCIGIVATMADALVKMNELSPNIDTAIDNVFYALEKIVDYFFGDADSEKANSLKRVGDAMSSAKRDSMINGFIYGGGFAGLALNMFGDGSSQIKTKMELISGCIGIVAQVADVISKMSNTDNINTSVNNLFTSLDKIIEYFTNSVDEDVLDSIEDVADELPDIIEYLTETVKGFSEIDGSIKNIKDFSDIALPGIKNIMSELNTLSEDYIDGVKDVSENLPEVFLNLSWCLDYMNGDYEKSLSNIKALSDSLSSFAISNVDSLSSVGNSFSDIAKTFINYSNNVDEDKMKYLNGFMDKAYGFAKIGGASVFDNVSNFIDKVNTIDIEKATALKDTFKSFTSINLFGGFFFSFKKQVGLFTDACIRLVDAINGNTDALSSENLLDENGGTQEENRSISISNTQELAELIADAISNNSFGGGSFGDAIPVELRINGEGGDSWVIRRY